MRSLLLLLLVLTLTAGCTTSNFDGKPENPEGESAPCVEWISFTSPDGWQPDWVTFGYGTALNGYTGFLVVKENETILGTRYVDYEMAGTNDAGSVTLDDPLNGTHTVRVVAYNDTNDDTTFDPETDHPCTVNGTVMQSNTKTVNFSELEYNRPPTTKTTLRSTQASRSVTSTAAKSSRNGSMPPPRFQVGEATPR